MSRADLAAPALVLGPRPLAGRTHALAPHDDDGRYVGAATFGSKLIVAILQRTGCTLALINDPVVFELTGREQADCLAFSDAIRSFVQRLGLRDLVLRGSPFRGEMTALPASYKIEAVLQLVPGLRIDVVPAQSITCWLNREEISLPSPPSTVASQLKSGLAHAIACAAYAALVVGGDASAGEPA